MSDAASSLLIDEFYEAGDDRFVDEVLKSASEKKLKSLADRWYRDPRPFARRALFRYVDDGCDRPHHRPLVKALFKLAEAAGDDELMGHFLVAFDALSRRDLVKRTGYDWQTRSTYEEWVLQNDRTVQARARREGSYKQPKLSKEGYVLFRPLPRFSRVTRQYLQRRAWRYFRNLARRDRQRYGRALRAALTLYRDERLAKPERLIDAWGLMHALYYGSPVLVRAPRGITVSSGRTLAELQPAPYQPDAWRDCCNEVIALAMQANSRTVRQFALGLLRTVYAQEMKGRPISELRTLLRSTHEEVQTWAVELLQSASGLHELALKEWLELLEIENPLALPLLCELVEKTVSPERLTLEQCLQLACQRAAPVAELGLKWIKGRRDANVGNLHVLVRLARAETPTVRKAAIDWVSQLLVVADAASPELVRELLDSRFADVREQALGLMDRDRRFGEATVLWSAMAESPYADVRERLVRRLQQVTGDRAELFAADDGNSLDGRQLLQHVWATTLLAVHRGGRARQTATRQLADRIVHHPDEASALLPLLGHTLRSIRPPERRAALASLCSAAHLAPALREEINRQVPELAFVGEEVAT